MVSSILIETDMKPTIFLGGEMDSLGGNLLRGSYDIMLTEACEYKRNFLKFNPTMEIILNIEEDHLDYYKNLEDIESAFVEYAQKIPQTGHLIVNEKHKMLFKNIKCNVITFGSDNNADYYPENISLMPVPSYTLMHKGQRIEDISLKVFGEHNILNSVAAAAAVLSLGVDSETIKNGLSDFKGTHRRYEYKGDYNGASIIDDYAHHPSEMKATLKTAKSYTSGKVITVFQPHTFTRTKKLLNEFAEALTHTDEVILLDIYAAREKDNGEIHSKDIIVKMNDMNKGGYYAESFQAAADIIKSLASEGDTIITMGAGNVNDVVDLLIDNCRTVEIALNN